MSRLIFLVLALAAPGCMTGFNREALAVKFQKVGVGSDEEISKIQALRPQTKFPCKVAVYLADDGSFRWTQQDKAQLEKWCAELVNDGVITELIFINDLFASGESSLKELRAAAAKDGADVLLTIRGATDVDEYVNPASLLNVTVVGAYVAPGHHRDALMMIRGALVDVNNGFLYATSESEGEGRTIRPYFLTDRKSAIEMAKAQAFEVFYQDFAKRLRKAHREFDKPVEKFTELPEPRKRPELDENLKIPIVP
jgi:rhombotail lipoprotein